MPVRGQLRIIAGDLKGRRVRVPETPGVRPTGDRVREALFSILGGRLRGGRVLDAFAGSGALGFEALSRGMDAAEFVEADRTAAEVVRANAAALGVAARCRVHHGDVVRLLSRGGLTGPYALVLADPPWADAIVPAFLAALAGGGALEAGGRVVVERAGRQPVPAAPDGLRHVRTAAYGRTALDFFTVEAAP
jgi:16S rRNA (guanine966-N2)-methyltransferase